MKKRAFLVQVSGIKYESFLPDYIFFSHRAYPDSTVIVLYEEKLNKKTLKSLEFLESLGCRFILKQIDFRSYLKMDQTIRKRFIYRTTGVFKCCGRFLIDLPEFHEFDEIYIGDVDLFIMKENSNLFEQHYIHSQFLGVPYSDILRKPFYFKLTFKKELRYILRYGLPFFKSKKNKPTSFYLNKMTGLRYIQVTEYFEKVSPYFEQFINLFGSLFSSQKQIDSEEVLTLYSFDDQQIVCLLMEKSFGSLPKSSNYDGIDKHDPKSYDYRPHHGIHVKLFYNSKTINSQIVRSQDYHEYLIQFKTLLVDKQFKTLSSFRYGLCRKLMNNLIKYLDKQTL